MQVGLIQDDGTATATIIARHRALVVKRATKLNIAEAILLGRFGGDRAQTLEEAKEAGIQATRLETNHPELVDILADHWAIYGG